MAKYFRARQDVSVPHVVSGTEEDDNIETTGENYPAGSIISAEKMHPRHLRLIEDGKLDHLLEPVDDDEGEHLSGLQQGGEPEFGVFIAEHEAEAHALEAYGHHVVPREQQMEALSASAEHARAYQEAVKEAGYDRRPAQEAMSQPRERVPEEFLYGSHTPSGAPHNRGPEQQADQGGEESEPATPAARPRPGADAASSESDQGGQAEGTPGPDSSNSEGSAPTQSQ